MPIGNWTPPATPGAPSKETTGDTILPDQRGRTGDGGIQPSEPAEIWQRGLRMTDGEPIRGVAPETSMEPLGAWGNWEMTSLHPSGQDTITSVPGPVAQPGRWPIPGSGIHGRLPNMQEEKDLGVGSPRLRLEGEVDNGGRYL